MADPRWPRTQPTSELDECVETDEVPVDDMDIHVQDLRRCYTSMGPETDSGRLLSQPGHFDSGVGLDSFPSSICQDFKQLSVGDHRVSNLTILSETSSDVCDSGWSEERLHSAKCPIVETDNNAEYTRPSEVAFFEQDEDGDTQLHMAIIQLVGGIAEYMIMRATDYFQVNLMNDLRQTPLHLSVITNQPHISKKLMLSGALLELTDNKGNTALHIACKEGYRDCVEVLTTPFYSEDVGCPYALPVQNVPQNLETVNYEGQTCLHLAADNYLRPQQKHTYFQIVQHLLNIGADVNAPDGKSGRTILHYTAEYGNMELMSVILKIKGVNLNATTYAGKTPLMLAIGRGFQDLAQKLEEAGARRPPGGFCSADSSDMSDEDSGSEYDDICIDGQPLTRS